MQTTEDRLKLITRNLEEVLTQDELKSLVESGTPLKHYIGYEVSGKLHIGQGLYTLMKVKDLQEAGVEVIIYLADWHAWLNKKLNGKLETINHIAKVYLLEAFKAAAICAGADPEKINFVIGSEFYTKAGLDYWGIVVKVAKATTLSRMLRSTTIMGRKISEVSDSAMLIYPAMQAADIFMLGVNIAHAGTDQRNVHVVARDAAEKLGYKKPVAIHAHLLQGLLKPNLVQDPNTGKQVMDLEAAKMSKSKPNSAIFIHDDPETIRNKINQAYCPEGIVEFNPILDWSKHLIFYSGILDNSDAFVVERKSEHGGQKEYKSYNELELDFANKKLHPLDLKEAVANWLIEKLEPARKYFEDPKRKEALLEIEKFNAKYI